MKGSGGPVFEHDFPPGSDMLGKIRDGPNAAERMEMELFDRLADHNSMMVCKQSENSPIRHNSITSLTMNIEWKLGTYIHRSGSSLGCTSGRHSPSIHD